MTSADDLRILVADDVVADVTKRLIEHLGKVDVARSADELQAHIARGRTWDVALVDLQWVPHRGGDSFDGLDVLDAITRSRLCPRAVIFTEGPRHYRLHLIEAHRSPIVVGAVVKFPSDLDRVIREVLLGRQSWDAQLPAGRPTSVLDLLVDGGSLSQFGRIVRAYLDGADDHVDIAKQMYVSSKTVKNNMRRHAESLIRVREVDPERVDDQPSRIVGSWVAREEDYLRSWFRRIGSHLDIG